MAFTGSTLCVSYLRELMLGIHDHSVGGDEFKMALFTEDASLGSNTTAYSTTNESSGEDYVAGGVALVNVEPVESGGYAYTQFENPVFGEVGSIARGALIYNASKENRAVMVLDFGISRTVSGVMQMPTLAVNSALIRLVL